MARRARRRTRGARLRAVRSSPRAARRPRDRGGGHAPGSALEADVAAPRLTRVDILYGRNPVLEALRAGRPARKIVVAAAIRPEARLTEILEHAEARDILVEEVSRQRLDDIAHTEHHQGVAGYFHARAALDLHDLLDQARPPALLVVLDGIQDPQNVGAIARSAEACSADGIVVPRHHAAPLTAAAVKASAGATEHLPMVTVPNLAQALEVIGAAGIWRVGLDADARDRYDTVDLSGPVADRRRRRGCGDAPAHPRALRRARVDSDDGSRRRRSTPAPRPRCCSSRCSASAASRRGEARACAQTLIVDGYNIIHAWPSLHATLRDARARGRAPRS